MKHFEAKLIWGDFIIPVIVTRKWLEEFMENDLVAI